MKVCTAPFCTWGPRSHVRSFQVWLATSLLNNAPWMRRCGFVGRFVAAGETPGMSEHTGANPIVLIIWELFGALSAQQRSAHLQLSSRK